MDKVIKMDAVIKGMNKDIAGLKETIKEIKKLIEIAEQTKKSVGNEIKEKEFENIIRFNTLLNAINDKLKNEPENKLQSYNFELAKKYVAIAIEDNDIKYLKDAYNVAFCSAATNKGIERERKKLAKLGIELEF